MTAALDRLECWSYVRRVRDTGDRRRVLVEITPQASHEARRFYVAHAAQSERLYQRYSKQQLELLLEFVREGRELNEAQARRLEQQSRRSRHSARPADTLPTDAQN
jgi:MarR family transcriptional regulator, organic hydroperoxide resistance regulator